MKRLDCFSCDSAVIFPCTKNLNKELLMDGDGTRLTKPLPVKSLSSDPVFETSDSTLEMSDLPVEIVSKILKHVWNGPGNALGSLHLVSVRQVCSTWKNIVNNVLGSHVCLFFPLDHPDCRNQHWHAKPLSEISNYPISDCTLRLNLTNEAEFWMDFEENNGFYFGTPHLVRALNIDAIGGIDCDYLTELVRPLFNLTKLSLHYNSLGNWTWTLDNECLQKLPLQVFKLYDYTHYFAVRHIGDDLPDDLGGYVNNLIQLLDVKWSTLRKMSFQLLIVRDWEVDIYRAILKFIINHKRSLAHVKVVYSSDIWNMETVLDDPDELIEHLRMVKNETKVLRDQFSKELTKLTSLKTFQFETAFKGGMNWVSTLWYEWCLCQRNLSKLTWVPQFGNLNQDQPFPLNVIIANESTLTSIMVQIDTTVYNTVDLIIYQNCTSLKKLVVEGLPSYKIPIGIRVEVINAKKLPKSVEYVDLRLLGLPLYVMGNLEEFCGGVPVRFTNIFETSGLVIQFTKSLSQSRRDRLILGFRNNVRCEIKKRYPWAYDYFMFMDENPYEVHLE